MIARPESLTHGPGQTIGQKTGSSKIEQWIERSKGATYPRGCDGDMVNVANSVVATLVEPPAKLDKLAPSHQGR